MWTKVEVFNHDLFVGSFYERDLHDKRSIINAINKEYGYGNWTRYSVEY